MSTLLAQGTLRKMQTRLESPVQYQLPLGDQLLPMNELLGESLELRYGGVIHCLHCGRNTRKSFGQGYCYPCFKRLAQCDSCIVRPQLCHYHQGTCREPEWGEQNCMIDHIVYLANSSGLKVGITRGSQVPTRWMDQGAIQALPIFRVASRLHSGLLEVAIARHVADQTNWRAMLGGAVTALDMRAERDRLLAECQRELDQLQQQHGVQAMQALPQAAPLEIHYPVREYPQKINSLNLDREGTVGGRLMGIKGQYLIFDSGVINVRKYGGYGLQLHRLSGG